MQPRIPEPCEVILLPEAHADLSRLRSLAPRVIKRLQSLALRPERGHPSRGDLSACRSLARRRYPPSPLVAPQSQ